MEGGPPVEAFRSASLRCGLFFPATETAQIGPPLGCQGPKKIAVGTGDPGVALPIIWVDKKCWTPVTPHSYPPGGPGSTLMYSKNVGRRKR